MLLKVAAEKKRNAAADAADKNILEGKFLFLPLRKLFIFAYKADYDERNENYAAQKSAQAVKGECAYACTLTLRYERKTPDNRCKNAVKRAEYFFFFDKISLQNVTN